MLLGGLGMEYEGTSLLAQGFMGRWLGVGIGVVMVEAPFPGQLLMWRCPPPGLGRTLEGHYRPHMSPYGDGVLGIGHMKQVHQ